MPKGPIQIGWESYLAKVVNPRSTFDQIAEMRRVFYAGAMITFVAMHGALNDDVSPKASVETLVTIENEIEAFQSELGKRATL